MTVEPIGLFLVLLGVLIIFMPPIFAIQCLLITSLLGAAAALKLPALGGASIQPVHFLLPFVLACCFLRKSWVNDLIASQFYPKPGFWLLLLTIASVLSAYFLPRMFSGSTVVFPLSRTDDGIVKMALFSRSSNLTNSVYFLGSLLTFAAIAGYISRNGALPVAKMILITSIFNLGFAFLDVVTYWTHTASVLEIIRNANYAILNEVAIGGLKRIIGSFPEASVYGYVSLGFYIFALQLWLQGVWPRFTGLISLLTLATLLLSTSSGTYVTLALVSVLVFCQCAWFFLSGKGRPVHVIYLFAAPSSLVCILLGLALLPGAWDIIAVLIDRMVLGKLETRSGIERMSWNIQAIQNFVDTGGLGAGLGSVRASGFPFVIISNLGLIGIVLYLIFFLLILKPLFLPRRPSLDRKIGHAAAWSCLTLLIGKSLSHGDAFMGILFCSFAAIAASSISVRSAINSFDSRSRALSNPGANPAAYTNQPA